MFKSHEIKLYPTKHQNELFEKSCGVARFTYNWALSKWEDDYKKGVYQCAYKLIKHLNSIKRIEFPWMYEVSKNCSQYPIHNLETAYKKFREKKSSFPKFKKKGEKDCFVAVENKQTFKQNNFRIWIPRIGWVRCSENLRFLGDVNMVTIKRVANMWFAVIGININPFELPTISENQAIVGIDMGIKHMIILSDGTFYENPKALIKNLKSLRRLQRNLSRKTKGSKNRKKQQIKVSRKHYRIVCIRKYAIHLATTQIIKKYDRIIIEDLRVRDMIKNKKLSQSIQDTSFGEISRQLAYKAQWSGKELVKASKWFASSKICSNCGNKKDVLKLSERVYKCDNCGIEINRDLNAAKNLANYGPTLKLSGSKACGEGSSVIAI